MATSSFAHEFLERSYLLEQVRCGFGA